MSSEDSSSDYSIDSLISDHQSQYSSDYEYEWTDLSVDLDDKQHQHQQQQQSHTCSNCFQAINDRFVYFVDNKYWHESCLRCDCCKVYLANGESGSNTSSNNKLYTKGGLNVCRSCYLRMFSSKGFCACCRKQIHPFDYVMRVKSLCFHLHCFVCHECKRPLSKGEPFKLVGAKKPICSRHHHHHHYHQH